MTILMKDLDNLILYKIDQIEILKGFQKAIMQQFGAKDIYYGILWTFLKDMVKKLTKNLY